MAKKTARRLSVGVLGCGAIAQAAHLESCAKARNVDLHAICDAAPDLLERMARTYKPRRCYSDYDDMLTDPDVDAVIVATSDAFHVKCSILALEAGKHVLCEKPLGVSVGEVEKLRQVVRMSGKVLQVGHMKRFDAGHESAKRFIESSMGEMLAFKAWYCDSTHRYSLTDATQPLIVRSERSVRPSQDPKADLRQYYMLAHGSHLVDTARYLAGEINEVDARLNERFGAFCWFIDVSFASGALGHLDLTVAVRMDWHEGFQVYGQHGSVLGKTYNPWLRKTSDVEIFDDASATTTRVLGPDGNFFRRQIEGFADTILIGTPQCGANIDDGLASVRAMVAIAESTRTRRSVRLDSVRGAV